MLLTIDVGNTNITLGVFRETELLGMFRMTTKRPRTSDEYGFTICGILEHRSIDPKKIQAVIIASVVPDIMHSLTSAVIKYLDTVPLIVSPESDTGIRVITDNPSRTGPDRIVNAVAGYARAGGAAMLPAIQIKKPDSILARETVSGMQGGLVFGAIGQTEYIVKKMKEESGYQDAYVIATGGLGKIIVKETEYIDLYDPQLTLNGLRLIYERMKGN